MDLNEKAIQDVIDLFDIKMPDNKEEPEDAVPIVSDFSDLEGDLFNVISSLEYKGESLESDITAKEIVEEPIKQEENNLETIEDLIASSVEEAKILTHDKFIQNEEHKAELEEESYNSHQESSLELQNKCDSVIVESEVIEEEVQILEDDFDSIIIDEALRNTQNTTSIDVVKESIEAEFSPTVLEDENIDIIPRKDSECNIKGEIKMKNVRDISWDKRGEPIISGGEILWNTESPSELYDEFYRIKKQHIDIFSCGQQLDFERLYADLRGCSVDISTEVLDRDILMKHLDTVVQCIDRVSAIQVQVNQQQFVWKRFVELLRGSLARVQYLKPVLKQDGLILEHMGDIEFYVERLNALKDSAHKISQNLEKAFDAVSRKVSVMLTVQTKHIDRNAPDAYAHNFPTYAPQTSITYVQTEQEETIQTNEDLDDYDGFDIGATVASVKVPSGECDWGDIF